MRDFAGVINLKEIIQIISISTIINKKNLKIVLEIQVFAHQRGIMCFGMKHGTAVWLVLTGSIFNGL